MESRFRRSLGRVGVSVEKNAKWFLEFSKLDLMTLDQSKIDDWWDDLITLSSDEGGTLTSGTVPRENIVTILISPGTSLRQDGKGALHKEGAMVTVPESVGETLVRQGFAEYLSYPLLPTGERSHEAVLQRWSHAAYWQRWRSQETRQVFWEIRRHISAIHTKIRDTLKQYLHGRRPLLDIKDVCLRVGTTRLSPVTPQYFWCMPNGSRYLEGPVLIRFVQVFDVYTRLLRRCPECKVLFIAGRTDQRFCKGNCRARRGMRRKPRIERPTTHRHTNSSKKKNHKKGGKHGKR